MNEPIEPLPFNLPPPTPRSSFARNLKLSSYLFPSDKRYSVSSSSALSSIGEEKQLMEGISGSQKGAMDLALTESKDSQLTSVQNNKKDMHVNFQTNVNAIDPQHVPTPEEKQRMWYTKDDYDGFKFNAAKEAGVRLFDYFPFPPALKQPDVNVPNIAQPVHKFVMIGNFDADDEKRTSLQTDAAVASRAKRSRESRTYHVPTKCHSEYADCLDNLGDPTICKRGLGYHFSRYRKRNRIWTRAMVLTWQKTLRNVNLKQASSQQQPLKLSQKCEVKLDEKSQRLLAVVSAKCSRTSRQAALWRGTMDHGMATGSRKVSFDHGGDAILKSNSEDLGKRVAVDDDQEMPKKKQRREDGKESTYTYLAGVLAVGV